MSFSNNCSKIDKVPGPIMGNPVNGICEKACIEVKKVFDACIKQETMQDVLLAMKQVSEGQFKEPYKFISAKSKNNAKIENLVIKKTGEGCLARITCNVVIPIEIVFVDADGKQGLGIAYMTIPKDVVMNVSQPSLIPYDIETIANVLCPEGVFMNANELSVSACTTIIMKVVMPVDLLVPTYGYCYIPPCQEYTEEVCDGVFDLPLFPQECGIDNKCK